MISVVKQTKHVKLNCKASSDKKLVHFLVFRSITRSEEMKKLKSVSCSFVCSSFILYRGISQSICRTTLQCAVPNRWCCASQQIYSNCCVTNLVQSEWISEYILTIFDDFKVVCTLIEYSELFVCDGNRRAFRGPWILFIAGGRKPGRFVQKYSFHSSLARNNTSTALSFRCLLKLKLFLRKYSS